MPTHDELAKIIGVKRKQNITEIIKKRQNIQPRQWKAFKDYFKIKEVQNGTEASHQDPDLKEGKEPDYKHEYLSLLKKNNGEKDKTINKLLTAVEKIVVVDQKLDIMQSTVHDLRGKFEEYMPIVLGLREFVTDEIAALTRKSPELVSAALGIKVAEQKKKAVQPDTRKD